MKIKKYSYIGTPVYFVSDKSGNLIPLNGYYTEKRTVKGFSYRLLVHDNDPKPTKACTYYTWYRL